MKKRMIKRALLGFVLSAVVMLGSANSTQAAQTEGKLEAIEDFKEISQTEAEAISEALTFGQRKSGSLENEEDVNWYKFTVTGRGYFKLDFKIDASTDFDHIGWGWDVEIFDKSDLTNPIKSRTGIKNNKDFEFPRMPMGTGTYFVKVSANYGNSAPVNCVYNIGVDFTATNYWEVENNDVNGKANTIAINTTYSGTSYHSEDDDWYKATVSQNGYLELSLAINPNTIVDGLGWGWDMSIYDSNYQLIKSYTGIKTSSKSPQFACTKGTYYVKVTTDYGNSAPIDCIYDLRLIFTPNAAWETEYNNTNVTADNIGVNKVYKGSLYQSGDIDWYKVNTTKAGYFKVNFALDPTVNVDHIGWGWDITVYDAGLNVIKEYTKIKSNYETQILPYAKGIYYVRVEANYGNSAPVDCIYQLKVAETASATWESEGNNDRQKADTIAFDKKYSGVLTNSDDQDWFKLKVAKDGAIKLDFNKNSATNIDDLGWGWDAYIYSSDSATPVSKLAGIKNSGSVTADLKKGTYYIKVCANYTNGAPTQCIYDFKVSFGQAPAKTTITKAKVSKQQITLQWKKSKNATGYYVYRSTSENGKYELITTIKKGKTVKYVDKKLAKKTTYYYKVVPYRVTKGITAAGPETPVKSAKTK